MGRITDERDHPKLNVREWYGPDPKRMVIDHAHPLNLESLHEQNVQSLIIEGGAETLRSFLALIPCTGIVGRDTCGDKHYDDC